MKLSIVTTLYHSARYLPQFHERITAEARKITDDYELLLVNDGSPDDSLEIALQIFEKDRNVRVIDLAQNYQHLKALMTGLAHARGDLVFLIDCDLEEEPELLGPFYKDLEETGADVIYGVQRQRKGRWLERAMGSLFYSVMNSLMGAKVDRNHITARLMRKDYVDALVQHREREIYLGGLFVITGFDQRQQAVVKHSRGQSSYTLRMKFTEAVNAITAFSNRPLILIFYVGTALMAVTGPYLGYLIVQSLFWRISVAGWSSLIVSVWFLGGLNLFMLGIIGIYLSKIFIETKNRPYTLIRRIYEHSADGPAAGTGLPKPGDLYGAVADPCPGVAGQTLVS